MNTPQTEHAESGCTDYLQHNAESCPHMNTPAQASGSHSPLPLIASVKVDKWLEDLLKILVDRSEFKLADHVVSARVVIKMLEKKRAEDKAHAQRLSDALKELVDEYWCNKGSRKNEFIACITPNTIPAYWRRADKALAQRNESPADSDALEALDQLEQLEGGELVMDKQSNTREQSNETREVNEQEFEDACEVAQNLVKLGRLRRYLLPILAQQSKNIASAAAHSISDFEAMKRSKEMLKRIEQEDADQ